MCVKYSFQCSHELLDQLGPDPCTNSFSFRLQQTPWLFLDGHDVEVGSWDDDGRRKVIDSIRLQPLFSSHLLAGGKEQKSHLLRELTQAQEDNIMKWENGMEKNKRNISSWVWIVGSFIPIIKVFFPLSPFVPLLCNHPKQYLGLGKVFKFIKVKCALFIICNKYVCMLQCTSYSQSIHSLPYIFNDMLRAGTAYHSFSVIMSKIMLKKELKCMGR